MSFLNKIIHILQIEGISRKPKHLQYYPFLSEGFTESRLKGRWQHFKNPLTCFRDGEQVVIQHEDKSGFHTRYFMTINEGKELWSQILIALDQAGAFPNKECSEEEKQAMVDAAQKVKNEL